MLVVCQRDPVPATNAGFHEVSGTPAEYLYGDDILTGAVRIPVELVRRMQLSRINSDETNFFRAPMEVNSEGVAVHDTRDNRLFCTGGERG